MTWTLLFNCLPVDIWLKFAFIELALLFNTEKAGSIEGSGLCTPYSTS